MADNIVTAGLNINVKRNGGSVNMQSDESINVLRSILEELRKGNRTQYVAGRKVESGFGVSDMVAGVSGGGILSRLIAALGTAGGTAAGVGVGGTIAAGAGLLGGFGLGDTISGGLSSTSYASVLTQSGEKGVAQIDKKTGEIVDILTQQEAEQMGILDEQGNVKDNWRDQNAEILSGLGLLKQHKESFVVQARTLEDLELLYDNQRKIIQDTNKALKIIRDRAAQEANLTQSDFNKLNEIGRNYQTPAPNYTPLPTSILERDSWRQQQQIADSLKKEKESSGSLYLDLLSRGVFGR